MAKATDVLEREHKVIQKAVALMAQVVEQLEMRHSVQPDILRDLLQFMRVFGDQCHHGKEESYLFPYLESKGVPATGCPLAALKGEHTKGRQLVKDFTSAIADYSSDPEQGRAPLIQVLQSLVALYPSHIWKEDFLLFPMAEKILTQGDHDLLLKDFDLVETGLGTDTHGSFETLIENLGQRIDQCPQCSQLAAAKTKEH